MKSRTLVRMATNTKPSARVLKAKRERGALVAERAKKVAERKARASRGKGYTREDLEALRDGRK